MRAHVASYLCLLLVVVASASLAVAQGAPPAVDERLAANTLSLQHYRAGRFAEALQSAEQFKALTRAAFGEEHPEYATALDNLGQIYIRLERPTEAEISLRQALAIRERLLPAGDPLIEMTIASLAGVCETLGRVEDALALRRRSAELIEKARGPNHLELVARLDRIADLLERLGRLEEAQPLLVRALAIREKALPQGDALVALSLGNLGYLYRQMGRNTEALSKFERALALLEKSHEAEAPGLAPVLNNIASTLGAMGRYEDAEPVHLRALALFEKQGSVASREVAVSLNNLAGVHVAQGHYVRALELYERAHAMALATLAGDSPDLAGSHNNLGFIYDALGRFDEAEPHFKRALEIAEKAFPSGHPNVAAYLQNLGGLYQAQGRYEEALKLYRRALALLEAARIRDNRIGVALGNIATVQQSLGHDAEAEALLKRIVKELTSVLPADHADVVTAQNNLGMLYLNGERYGDALPLLEEALARRKSTLPPLHPSIVSSTTNLAAVYDRLGRKREAAELATRALEIADRVLPPSHPQHIAVLANAAANRMSLGEADAALALLRGAARETLERGALQVTAADMTQLDRWKTEGLAGLYADAAFGSTARQVSPDSAASETFTAAQIASGNAAARAIWQMASRLASGTSDTAKLIRARQDLTYEIDATDRRLITAYAGARSADADRQTRDLRQTETNQMQRLVALDAEITAKATDVAALVVPKPVDAGQVQRLLAADEALVTYLFSSERGYAWVVTGDKLSWVELPITAAEVAEAVQKLRCGLEYTDDWGSGRGLACLSMLNLAVAPASGELPPYDLAVAHELYRSLFEPIAPLIADRRLLVVPAGAMTRLPLHVLVTAPPAKGGPYTPEDYRGAAWLARRHAITVLPSVASLVALRGVANSGAAPSAYLGIGNPLLAGNDGNDRRAWETTHCSPVQVAALTLPGVGRPMAGPSTLVRGASTLDDIKRWPPLPETAEELCNIAAALGSPAGDVLLGPNATEARIKTLSAAGGLAQFRIVHFATHGLLPDETRAIGRSAPEAALILTPPDNATADDDGLLTASEVADLRLSADWVVLSACNTASGGANSNSEALSGLARSFFYAGARSLLVSHWYVESGAVVRLTTRAFAELEKDPGIGRAEALRRSMIALVDSGDGWTSHPSLWAPFVLVGEGAR